MEVANRSLYSCVEGTTTVTTGTGGTTSYGGTGGGTGRHGYRPQYTNIFMPNPYTVPLIVDETDVANVKKAVETKVENTNADKTPIIMQKIAASKKDTKQFGTMLVAGSIGIGAGYLVAKKMGLNAMLFATLSGLALAGATMVMSNK